MVFYPNPNLWFHIARLLKRTFFRQFTEPKKSPTAAVPFRPHPHLLLLLFACFQFSMDSTQAWTLFFWETFFLWIVFHICVSQMQHKPISYSIQSCTTLFHPLTTVWTVAESFEWWINIAEHFLLAPRLASTASFSHGMWCCIKMGKMLNVKLLFYDLKKSTRRVGRMWGWWERIWQRAEATAAKKTKWFELPHMSTHKCIHGIFYMLSDKKLRWSFLCAKVWCRNRKKGFCERETYMSWINTEMRGNQAFLMQIYTRVREIEVVIATRWKKKICLQWRQSIYQIATNLWKVLSSLL